MFFSYYFLIKSQSLIIQIIMIMKVGNKAEEIPEIQREYDELIELVNNLLYNKHNK